MKLTPEYLGPEATDNDAWLMARLLKQNGVDLDSIERADEISQKLWDKCLDAVSRKHYGGARKGSGRKPAPEPLQTISVTLYASQVQRLKATGNASQALREILHLAAC